MTCPPFCLMDFKLGNPVDSGEMSEPSPDLPTQKESNHGYCYPCRIG